jgi:hypothetical protein
VRSTLPKSKTERVLHKNFMEYLVACYKHHFSIVLTPDMVSVSHAVALNKLNCRFVGRFCTLS